MAPCGSTCAVVGCTNNTRKLKDFMNGTCFQHKRTRLTCCPAPYALHSMPKDETKTRAWLAALKLKNPPKRVYVCSYHFIDRKPTELNPNPELFLGYERQPVKKRRKLNRCNNLEVQANSQTSASTSDIEVQLEQQESHCNGDASSDTTIKSVTKCSVQTQWEDPALLHHGYAKLPTNSKDVRHQATQCSVAHNILLNDSDSLLYTGIPLETFNTLVSVLEQFAGSFKMSTRDQVLLTLMKLRLNLMIGDLSRRFFISESLSSKIISYWIDKLEEVLRNLIPWLPRETIRATMPLAFKTNYPKTTCILDCSESLLQKPKNLDSRGESYSHYYSHNTVKYLVSIAPCGLIMFISAAYGGRCSDKFITMDSGILEYLQPGDEVMADRGFTIRDILFDIPSFTKKGAQLTEEQVTSTRRIANVRIHVERAIRRIKVFKILSQVVPISLVPKVDKILRICSALVNLRGDLIRDGEQ
ncbi:hypothetical protein N1851_021880 [Merluccius polli]|uniref:THAP-type domain-containing protein n=1 Tax=Merluccius polli TaxID=89951 RepID=A0AA47MJA7_MERPO|nr:hypothetical protein N1851_021880 [Merluccius polli]